MNRQSLSILVRRLMAEAGSAVYTADSINDQLNRSAAALAQQNALFRRRVSLTSDVDGAVSLPSDAVAVINVWSNAGRYHLTAVSPQDAPLPGEPTGSAYSAEYSYDPAWGPGLTIYPARVLDLTVDLLVTGPAMGADTTPPWGGQWETYHDVIAMHAAYHLGGWGGGSGAAQQAAMQRYQIRMDEFKAAVAIQTLSHPMQVVGVQPRRHRRYL